MPIATIQLPNGRKAKIEVPKGATNEQIEEFVMSQPQFQEVDVNQEAKPSFIERLGQFGVGKGGSGLLPSKETLAKVPEALLELGPGLGELGAGAFQIGSELLGREDLSRKIGQQVAKEREGLTGAQKAGRAIGQIIGTAPIGGVGLGGAIASGSAVSALSPTQEGTLTERLKQTETGALVSAATFGIIKGTGAAAAKTKEIVQNSVKGIKSGLGIKTIEQIGEGTQALKNKASQLYDDMRKIGADLNPRTVNKITTDLDKTLLASGKLNSKLHGDTLSVLKGMRADTKAGELSLEGLDQYRQLLGQVVKKNTEITGSVTPDGLKANILIDKIDDIVEKLNPSDLGKGGKQATELLSQARNDWGIYKKYEKIASLAEKADGDPNRIKQVFQSFINNKKNLRGFNPDEIKALRNAATNETGEKLLKQLGKFGFDLGSSATQGNTALPVASIFAGGLAGSPIGGAALAASGTVARKAQKLIASGKVNDALTLIQSGGNSAAEIISKIPNEKARTKLLTKLLSVGAAQQSTQ